MQLPLREIIAELPKEEIDGVAESMSYSRRAGADYGAVSTVHGNHLESRPDIAEIERELVEDQLNHGHSLSIFLAADHPFEDISDEDVDSVIKKLNDASL